ncbi:HPr-rel-A system PqqD family peptide chaperone [Sphingomonadaceae bacterium jetA1]|jgi:PqqD family protein of HPr-rel-A system|uniref:HPr-rel-A system PqqD family peptide chaperone n=1 Tax=Facivitalis istanbulensis TaxID=3075838 RepID=UPI003492DFC4
MAGPRYRAVAAESILVEPLDLFTALFHRPSGITHILSEPAPQILAALGEQPLDAVSLLTRLAREFDLGEAEGPALLRERLDELEAVGLIERL